MIPGRSSFLIISEPRDAFAVSKYSGCMEKDHTYDIEPCGHRHSHVLCDISSKGPEQKSTESHTTVIGMAGAWGKMKAFSLNLDRRRQFSDRNDLGGISKLVKPAHGTARHTIHSRYHPSHGER